MMSTASALAVAGSRRLEDRSVKESATQSPLWASVVAIKTDVAAQTARLMLLHETQLVQQACWYKGASALMAFQECDALHAILISYSPAVVI